MPSRPSPRSRSHAPSANSTLIVSAYATAPAIVMTHLLLPTGCLLPRELVEDATHAADLVGCDRPLLDEASEGYLGRSVEDL